MEIEGGSNASGLDGDLSNLPIDDVSKQNGSVESDSATDESTSSGRHRLKKEGMIRR